LDGPYFEVVDIPYPRRRVDQQRVTDTVHERESGDEEDRILFNLELTCHSLTGVQITAGFDELGGDES
jgi:hypothetical protein